MRALPITGEYPADWNKISDATWAAAGHRCIRCMHPYRKGEHGKGEWSPCDVQCRHFGPLGVMAGDGSVLILPEYPDETTTERHVQTFSKKRFLVVAQWRIGTVHHLDGNKANCRWWNLLALCQRCHLSIQCRVNPQQPYMFEHSEWFRPYVAAFYAWKYEGREITREEAVAEMSRLLALERIA